MDLIDLPNGFSIDIYAEDIPNARSMALSDNGVLFVGNSTGDKVYALIDQNQDNKVDKKYIIARDLNMPYGVALKNGDLYVSEVNRILRFPNCVTRILTTAGPAFSTNSVKSGKPLTLAASGKLVNNMSSTANCNVILCIIIQLRD